MSTTFPAKLEKISLALLALITLAVILLFIALGQYAHPSADDLCMAEGVQREGLWPHLWHHYQEWSGRYSGNAFYAIYPLLSGGLIYGYKFIALLLLLSLFTATAFFLSRLFLARMNGWPVVITALLFTTVYVLGLRSPASSLYWMAGSLSYLTANILLLLMAGLMLQLTDRQHAGKGLALPLAASLLVVLLAVGANETGMLMTAAAVTAMLLARLRKGWRAAWPWLVLFAIAAACSAVVYFAPGNTVRESTFRYGHDLVRAIQGSLGMGAWTMLGWVQNPVFLLATVLTPFMAALLARSGMRQFQPRKRHLALFALATLLLPILLEFPAWWAIGGWPPVRTVDAIYFVFLCAWLFTVGAFSLYFMPNSWRENGSARLWTAGIFLAGVALFALAIYTNGKFQHAIMDWQQTAPAFNAYIQQRYALIEDANQRGKRRLIVPAFEGERPRTVYFNDIMPLSHDWRNICYARYFDLVLIKRKRSQNKPQKPKVRPPSPAWTQTPPEEEP
ncbi:MAG: hypothetical protein R3E93_02145 [Thiothrix sp.]